MLTEEAYLMANTYLLTGSVAALLLLASCHDKTAAPQPLTDLQAEQEQKLLTAEMGTIIQFSDGQVVVDCGLSPEHDDAVRLIGIKTHPMDCVDVVEESSKDFPVDELVRKGIAKITGRSDSPEYDAAIRAYFDYAYGFTKPSVKPKDVL